MAETLTRRTYRWIEDEFAPGGKRRVLVRTFDGEEGYEVSYVQSCSGCFEGGEYGGMAHHYPFDAKAGCHLGGGCHECGYTGKRRTIAFISFAGGPFAPLASPAPPRAPTERES